MFWLSVRVVESVEWGHTNTPTEPVMNRTHFESVYGILDSYSNILY